MKKNINVACHDDDGLVEVQKKGFECYGCKKCADLLVADDYGPIPTKYSNGANNPPDHGSCRPWCKNAIEGTSETFYSNRFCGGSDKDGNTRPAGTYASSGCFTDAATSPISGNPNRKNYVCNHWRQCTGCSACTTLATNTDIFPEGFGPSRPKDVYGDGSRMGGECRWFCKSRFNFDTNTPYYAKWNDGTDGGTRGTKVVEGATSLSGFTSINAGTAPSDICTWQSCSGCQACINWATADDTTIVPGTTETYAQKYGANDGFRFREPLDDYVGDTNSRKKKRRIGACEKTCKAKFADTNNNVRDLCTLDECDGCDPCRNPAKYDARFSAGLTISSGERLGTNSEDSSLTWARTATCPGFPKCWAYDGVCENRFCGKCDECQDTARKSNFGGVKPTFK